MNERELLSVKSVRHAWPEKNENFLIDRPHGHESYVFIHLWNPVDMFLAGESIRTEPSACVIFDKSYHQKWKPLKGGIVHDWIHIDGDLPSLLAKAGLEFNRIYYPKPSDFITALAGDLEMEFFAEKNYYRELCDMKLRELFFRISRCSGSDAFIKFPDADTADKLKHLRNEVFSDLANCPSVGEMARRLSVSESKFYVIYKEVFGISPMADIINARIENAKNYLSSGIYSVEQTAELVGYKNTFHFIRQFKQVTGKTPGKFFD